MSADRAGSFAVVGVEQVRIGVERDAGLGMPQLVGNLHNVELRRDQCRCVRVAKRMK